MADAALAEPACYHCGLPVAQPGAFCLTIAGVTREMCCPACKQVAEIIVQGGFDQYYQRRDGVAQRPDLALNEGESQGLSAAYSAYDAPELQQSIVTAEADGEASVRLLIGGVHCAACGWLIEQQLSRLNGVKQASVNVEQQQAVVRWHPQQCRLSEICAAIAAVGYSVEPFSQSQLEVLRDTEHRQALRRLGVAGIGMMQVGMFAIAQYAAGDEMLAQYRDMMRWTSLLIATWVVFYAARPFFSNAWNGLKGLTVGMDLPVAIAIGLAYLASMQATVVGQGEIYFDSVTMFTFFLLSGRYFEMRARHHYGRVTSDVMSLLPVTVLRAELRAELGAEQSATSPINTPETLADLAALATTLEYQAATLTELQPGDLLLIKPGQVLAADGRVIVGSSHVDESALNGEFMPQSKGSGDPVYAGSLNVSEALYIQVTATAAESRLSYIKQLLEKAQQAKPLVAEYARRVALWFVIVVLFATALVWLFWHWQAPDRALAIAIAVLVVSCPCALSLAIPTALTAATTALRREGLLVTNQNVWQYLPRIRKVIFDKTGTLTRGCLELLEVREHSQGCSEERCLQIAAALERGATHPIATAFSHYDTQLQVSDYRSHSGRGVEARVEGHLYRLGQLDYVYEIVDRGTTGRVTGVAGDEIGEDGEVGEGIAANEHPLGNNWIAMADEHGLVAQFQLRDELRDDAKAVLQRLSTQGAEIHLLSGDDSGAAAAVARELGINKVVEGAQPQQKLEYLQLQQQAGNQQTAVMMVGDGINDIPVLAAADVSVAMAGASDLAKTSADCILLNAELAKVPVLFERAAQVRRIIRQNLIWALCYNLSALPLAASGYLPPYLAAVGMSLSSLLVILNSMRLSRITEPGVSDRPRPAVSNNTTAAVSQG